VSDENPTLAFLLARALETQLIHLRVGLPGRIEKFDAATQLADVQPLLQEEYPTANGKTAVASLPVITNVPVFTPGGSNFVLTTPIEAGAQCWLQFSDRSLDVWNDRGGIVDPVDPRRHDLTDAICIVGVRSQAAKVSEYDANAIQLGKVGGPRVRVKADSVHLGVDHAQDATEAAVLGSTYRDKEDTWFSDLATQLTAAGSALAAASLSLTAASVANAAPVVGGAASAPLFAAAATALNTAATALSQVAVKLAAFTATATQYLSTRVKVK